MNFEDVAIDVAIMAILCFPAVLGAILAIVGAFSHLAGKKRSACALAGWIMIIFALIAGSFAFWVISSLKDSVYSGAVGGAAGTFGLIFAWGILWLGFVVGLIAGSIRAGRNAAQHKSYSKAYKGEFINPFNTANASQRFHKGDFGSNFADFRQDKRSNFTPNSQNESQNKWRLLVFALEFAGIACFLYALVAFDMWIDKV